MPRAGEYATSKKKRDEAIKRHLEGGESVGKLHKEYRVTRQTMYAWLDTYKKGVLEIVAKAGMSSADLEKRSKAELVAQIQALKAENSQLKNRLVAYVLRDG